MIHSLRWRVMLGTAALTAVFLVAAGVAMMLLLKQSLLQQLDTHLDSAGQSLTTAFENHDEKPHFEWEGIGDGPPIIFRAWDSNGKILTQSSLPVSIADEKRPQLIGNGSQTGDALLSDASLGRYLLLSFIPHLEGGHEHEDEGDDNHRDEESAPDATHFQAAASRIYLEVAAPLSEIHNVINLATRQVFLVSSLAVVGATLLIWPLTTMMIHPLNQLSAQINQLHPRDLQQRIDITDCPSELIPVVHRLNEFIVQLEEAFDRERTTTANISHELRTPLAGLMATLEVAASRPRSTAEYQTTISQSTEILNQLQSLIERILLLSRLDAYKLVINPELIDLNKLLHEIASGYQVDSSIKWQLATGIMINTDKPSLTLIIRNLLANAITYSTAPDAIAIRTHLQSGEVTIELTNPSAVIAPSDLSQLKQRFFQSDANRIRNGQNGGLGLTFCDELANLIHGKLSLSQSHGIFRAVVAFHSHNS